MSTLAVKVERIKDVLPHTNADRLEIAQVLDWNVVVGKGTYKPGDLCVYVPIDSILPADLETYLFPEDSKVKLSKSRIKTIKLRGAISQGMTISLDDLKEFIQKKVGYPTNGPDLNEGRDLTEWLGITKYEPPVKHIPGQPSVPRKVNPHFHKYTDIENAKNYPDVFEEGEEVVVTEKIHGSNFRAGYVPFEATTLWKKVLRFFKLTPDFEFVYGSHNVQLHDRSPGNPKGWYSIRSNSDNMEPIGNIYLEMVEKYNLRNMLFHGEVVYGEVYGEGVQKNYLYDCKPGERKLVLFDIMANGEYKDTSLFEITCIVRRLPMVPILYKGPYNKEAVQALSAGPSVLCPQQSIREGVVVKPATEGKHPLIGRKVLKIINSDYLLKDQSEFH